MVLSHYSLGVASIRGGKDPIMIDSDNGVMNAPNNSIKKQPEMSRADKVLDILIEIDRVHKENDGKLTIDEIKLRLAIKINLNLWSISNKLKSLHKFLRNFIKKFFPE